MPTFLYDLVILDENFQFNPIIDIGHMWRLFD